MSPRLSVVVIFFNMQREAARTLHSLSSSYQRGVDSGDIEIIAIDNGSTAPLDPDMVTGHGPNFSYRVYDAKHPSPVAALNYGASLARGELLACMIDGARMLSPGILANSLLAAELYRRPFAFALSFHLGPKPQKLSMREGYDQVVEDRLLDSIAWPVDGYRLFEISALGGSCRSGFFGRDIKECGYFAMRKSDYVASGGFDERFVAPGGGLANLDFFQRMSGDENLDPILLLGEGTFHQMHGGIITNSSEDAVSALGYRDEYLKIRGAPYRSSELERLHYLGSMPETAMKFLHVTNQGTSSALHRMRQRAKGWLAAARKTFNPS